MPTPHRPPLSDPGESAGPTRVALLCLIERAASDWGQRQVVVEASVAPVAEHEGQVGVVDLQPGLQNGTSPKLDTLAWRALIENPRASDAGFSSPSRRLATSQRDAVSLPRRPSSSLPETD